MAGSAYGSAGRGGASELWAKADGASARKRKQAKRGRKGVLTKVIATASKSLRGIRIQRGNCKVVLLSLVGGKVGKECVLLTPLRGAARWSEEKKNRSRDRNVGRVYSRTWKGCGSLMFRPEPVMKCVSLGFEVRTAGSRDLRTVSRPIKVALGWEV